MGKKNVTKQLYVVNTSYLLFLIVYFHMSCKLIKKYSVRSCGPFYVFEHN